MALGKHVVSVPLSQGIDTKTDPKQLQLGKLVFIRNLVFDELGDLSPRNGFASLTQSIVNTGAVSTGVTLATLNASLVLADGSSLYSYAESLAKWAPKGQKIAVSLSTFSVSGAAVNASVQDSALHSGGCAIYTWINSATSIASYSVLDTNTQTTIVQEGTQASGTNAKPCVIGANSSFTVFLQNGAHIAYESITLANPAVATAASNLVTITSGSAPFDACTGSVYGYIFYVNGSTDLAVSRIDATNAVVNTATLTGQTGTSLTCWYDTTNNYVWLMWYSGTVVKYAVYTSALVSVLATTSIVTTSAVTRMTGMITSGTTSTAYYETAGAADANDFISTYTLTAAGVATSVSSLRSVGLAGKAFTYSGVTYAIAVHSSSLQSTYFLVRPTGFSSYAQGTVVGKLAPLIAGGTPAIKTLANTYATTTGKYAFAYLLQANPTTISGVVQNTKSIQSALFDFAEAPRKLTLANNLQLTGALITNYDSGSSTEYGFNLFPEGGSFFQPATLGGLASGGTYSYKFTYEWVDEQGQTHRSAPSTGLLVELTDIPMRITNGASDTSINLELGDTINSTRFVYVGATVEDVGGGTTLAANTRITAISDDNTVAISPADSGGTFSVTASLISRKTFVWGTASGTSMNVTKPTVLVVNATFTSGSTSVFAAVTSGLVVGQGVTDNTGDLPGGTTISAFTYKNGGAVLTLSAAPTASYDNTFINITHSVGWPITLWLSTGQIITGTGIPTSTAITRIAGNVAADSSTVVTVSEALTAQSGTFAVDAYYNGRLNLPTLCLTEKGRVTQPVQIAVWRTVNNGTQYYKCGYAANDTTVDTVTFYDYTGDDDLVGNTALYTNGGEVENIAPPASDFITSYKNRAIVLPSEDLFSWWYSKQVVTGTPVEFSDLFSQSIDQRGGPLTGGSPLDDKLIFFKQKDIFYVVGDGPAPSGANNDFSYPQQITTPCGCTEPKSIVTVPIGIIFKSAKGFYLLDRGLNVAYIGAEVEDFNSFTVTSAQLTATGTQVRFTLSGGLCLVYDYYVGQWSVFDNITAVDSVIYGNTYAYLTTGGLVALETPGVYSDLGAVIVPSFRTGWISFDKIQNFQRIWSTLLVGTYFSPHTLVMTAAQDFDSTATQTTTVTLTSSITPYQIKFPMIRQKCEAAQLTFTLTPASVAGQGAAFSALTFETGIKKGSYKVPAAKTYGGTAS